MAKHHLRVRVRSTKLILGAVLISVCVVLSAGVWLAAIGGWLSMPATQDLVPAETIIVHGGNVNRTTYAITLFRHRLAPELWHTGYAKGEPVISQLVARARVVPDGAFHFLATTSMWSDGTEIVAAIRARKLHSVIIVTDWWHSRRALCSVRQQLHGYDVAISFEPSPSPAGPDDWWRYPQIRADVGSELVKMVYYAVRYGWHPWGC